MIMQCIQVYLIRLLSLFYCALNGIEIYSHSLTYGVSVPEQLGAGQVTTVRVWGGVASTPGPLTFDMKIGGPGSRWHVTGMGSTITKTFDLCWSKVRCRSVSLLAVELFCRQSHYSSTRTWPWALWNDVMVKGGISMDTPTLVESDPR